VGVKELKEIIQDREKWRDTNSNRVIKASYDDDDYIKIVVHLYKAIHRQQL